MNFEDEVLHIFRILNNEHYYYNHGFSYYDLVGNFKSKEMDIIDNLLYVYDTPAGRSYESHKFLLMLNNEYKFKNLKFVKKINKKAMTKEELFNYSLNKKNKLKSREERKEVRNYFFS